jgi:hypothetical protein
LAFARRRLRSQEFANVLDAQENPRGLDGRFIEPAGVEQHGARADGFKVVGDLEVVKETVAGQDLFQQFAQTGNVPLAIAQFINQPALRFRRRNVERAVERSVRCVHAQIGVQNHQRVARGADDGLGIIAGFSDRRLALFELVNVQQHEQRAVNPIIQRLVRLHAHHIPAPLRVLDLALRDTDG